MDTPSLIDRLLDVIEHDIAPKTRIGVTHGNKLFGAAILRKSDLSVVIAETNNETENPLWHGEMHAIKRFYELPAETRPDPKDCIFIATHEPCSLCLSGITWSGFDNFYYLFTYVDSATASRFLTTSPSSRPSIRSPIRTVPRCPTSARSTTAPTPISSPTTSAA